MSYNYNQGLAYAEKMLGSKRTMFTREQRAVRKQTIRKTNFMALRDRLLGVQPTPPPLVVHHPRAFNPPLSCKDGRHQWETGMLMGIPRLKCKKCGHIAFKGSFEGTETKREIRERHIQKLPPPEPNFTVTRYEK